MARNELIYRGPLTIDGGAPISSGAELWSVGTTVVAFARDGRGQLIRAGMARDAVAGLTSDYRLEFHGVNDDGLPVTIAAAAARQGQGTWGSQTVRRADGSVVATSATVEWSNQGATIIVGSERTELPAAKTFTMAGARTIEDWTGDPARRYTLVAAPGTGGCGCSGK